jgi:hypothetical protein
MLDLCSNKEVIIKLEKLLNSGLEIDFIICYKNQCTLVEAQTTTGNSKSTKTLLAHPDKYHVHNVIKLGHYNVGRKDQILILPLYMGFLLVNDTYHQSGSK